MADLQELDGLVARAARKVRILGPLSWPASVEDRFFEALERGDRQLPDPPPVEAHPEVDELLCEAIDRADRGDPLQAFVRRTAESYRTALAMLQAAGTPAFLDHSRALYGHPRDETSPGGPTLLDEAEHLLEACEAMDLPVPEATIADVDAQAWLQEQVDAHFERDLPVELDPDLTSLAAAGSKRIRLRAGRPWARVQLEQLRPHAALVHTATKRNGRRQETLTCLGYSSPRTTAVQEGLATLAELITDTLDLQRLRRIALRVQMVDRVLEGADFLDIFDALREAGQPDREAFRSAMRVFRGGDVTGGLAFTKDLVYLGGLRRVHSFLLAALRAHRQDLPQVLFAGRMTCGDALVLAPYLEDGTLEAPAVVPDWIANEDRLAAYLAWAAFGQELEPRTLDDYTIEAD